MALGTPYSCISSCTNAQCNRQVLNRHTVRAYVFNRSLSTGIYMFSYFLSNNRPLDGLLTSENVRACGKLDIVCSCRCHDGGINRMGYLLKCAVFALINTAKHFHTCLVHKQTKTRWGRGEEGLVWRVECNNTENHNHFLSSEHCTDGYSKAVTAPESMAQRSVWHT